MSVHEFETAAGVSVRREEETTSGREAARAAIEPLIDALDERRGAAFASTCEIPGRYALWDRGFVDPPIAVECRGRDASVQALNDRGRLLLPVLRGLVSRAPGAAIVADEEDRLRIAIETAGRRFAEEDRSRQPSVFGLLREIVRGFASPDPDLGLYGAFGYDLAFQFDPLPLRHPRAADQRDLVLYLPDEIVVVDHRREQTHRVRFDFRVGDRSTRDLPRTGESRAYHPGRLSRGSDHEPGEYAQVVRRARAAFARGDLFEVVPSQVFSEGCPPPPSEVFRRLRARNPAPYGFLVALGSDEYLVGASPEMFVRVGDPDPRSPSPDHARRVETCPIAGTIARGRDPLEDARQIQKLLESEKDACELTMCTDVDRNDKSRVCEPGSVEVTGRRQIELYSKLIHTVDHVQGRLQEGRDALDAFLTHAWAVTVTGAPKAWAMRFIEEHELSPRRFYGGAVGRVGFDGRLDTGLTLRTIRIAEGVAETRVGATLLYDSDPDEEEAETRLKAAALLDAIRADASLRRKRPAARRPAERRVLLVDCEDSFVHTLGSYFRQAGCEVVTWRVGFDLRELDGLAPELLVVSPGPGRPADFDLDGLLGVALDRELPIFGVCLGLQAIAEHFGGALGVLPEPVHGKASHVTAVGGRLLQGLPREFQAGRYHSLHVLPESLPEELRVTAVDDLGRVMAVEHRYLPVAGVQFHPESILTLEQDFGLRLIENAVARLARPRAAKPLQFAPVGRAEWRPE